MHDDLDKVKYLKDYEKPEFSVSSIDLTIDLNDENAIVTNIMKISSINRGQPASPLVLDGCDQELISVKLDGKAIDKNNYYLTKDKLIIPINHKNEFDITIAGRIVPQTNTSLSGLFQADDIFLTQCEPNGFSRITYFIDRPDIMTYYTTKLIADRKYTVLLSNGDKIDQGELPNNKHFATWHDKTKKPSYLFAAVIGDLKALNDNFITRSGKSVDLRLYAPAKDLNKAQYAMDSLKAAMRWDENVYGCEYDLDTYMIVSTPKFNFGAMENKGLNIFNSKYILANKDTTTDEIFKDIYAIVGHEYFHNWTGNRITLRDWFQLSLKEGLTVFRDQEFSADQFGSSIKRIEDAELIRTAQFQEDAGPLSHPVRPESYIKMDNFYTHTVYDKGAELVRMIQTIIGKDNFFKGMDIYFKRHDGEAVTTDEFVKAMGDAGQTDLSQFKLWYSQSGTPQLSITSYYDKKAHTYRLIIKQSCKDLATQDKNLPFHIPIRLGLIGGHSGNSLDFVHEGKNGNETVLHLKSEKQEFIFTNVPEEPIPSLLRDFSAPVKINYPYTDEQLLSLLAYDNNEFNRWDAGQKFLTNFLLNTLTEAKQNKQALVPANLINSIKSILNSPGLDKAFIAKSITIPSEMSIYEAVEVINAEAIFSSRKLLQESIGKELQSDFLSVYNELNALLKQKAYSLLPADIAARLLKNLCLDYITHGDTELGNKLAEQQLDEADNLTDRLAALAILANANDDYVYNKAINNFYDNWKSEELVIDKWLAVQASSERKDTLDRIKRLMKHPAFDIRTPNKVYALFNAFSSNSLVFHASDGSGYDLYANFILKEDKINPPAAAILVKVFENWEKFELKAKQSMQDVLKRIKAQSKLSDNVNEVVGKMLGKKH